MVVRCLLNAVKLLDLKIPMSLVHVPNEITVQKLKINSKSVGEGENGGRKDVMWAEDNKDEECGKGVEERRRGQSRVVCKGLKKHCSNAMTATRTAGMMLLYNGKLGLLQVHFRHASC